jgi:hypothetical protein
MRERDYPILIDPARVIIIFIVVVIIVLYVIV